MSYLQKLLAALTALCINLIRAHSDEGPVSVPAYWVLPARSCLPVYQMSTRSTAGNRCRSTVPGFFAFRRFDGRSTSGLPGSFFREKTTVFFLFFIFLQRLEGCKGRYAGIARRNVLF